MPTIREPVTCCGNVHVCVALAADKKQEPESEEEDDDMGFGLFD